MLNGFELVEWGKDRVDLATKKTVEARATTLRTGSGGATSDEMEGAVAFLIGLMSERKPAPGTSSFRRASAI